MKTRSPHSSEIIRLYQANIRHQQDAIRYKKKIKNGLAVARFAVVLLAVAAVYLFWPSVAASVLSIGVCGIGLSALVFADAGKTEEIKNQERLMRINQHEIDAMAQQLSSYDDGHRFADPVHAYASDLDLFGPASLYQFISRCHADQSKRLLADHLLRPLPLEQIKQKQEAAKELSEKTAWCQQFQSNAMANPLSAATEKRLEQWIQEPAGIFEKSYWKGITLIYSCISLTILVLYILDQISFSSFLFCLVCFFGISSLISSKIQPTWVLLSRIGPEMDALYEQVHAMENGVFQAAFLQQLKNNISVSGNPSASIRQFRGILKRFDFRLNLLVIFFLNTFLLWDLRQMTALTSWKKKNKEMLAPWFRAIAETEVLISLASLFRNQPEWCVPLVNDRYFNLNAQDLGHPLIPADKMITNSFNLEGLGKITIITGSNMAGKSTFLRSLGTNLVLAFMGAPVSATAFEASLMFVLSSMRVADNLAENTSTFYAELKKLQFIIERVNLREPVFILLDEVLRGTNSTDRHAGTKALIRQLIRQQAVAVIATHDTDLAKYESEENPVAIRNDHFDGQIRDGELYFDYSLREGICESLNATLLMKKIGIHFEE
jgi:ABC-type iron transport system FetAB ATPase subunit